MCVCEYSFPPLLSCCHGYMSWYRRNKRYRNHLSGPLSRPHRQRACRGPNCNPAYESTEVYQPESRETSGWAAQSHLSLSQEDRGADPGAGLVLLRGNKVKGQCACRARSWGHENVVKRLSEALVFFNPSSNAIQISSPSQHSNKTMSFEHKLGKKR